MLSGGAFRVVLDGDIRPALSVVSRVSFVQQFYLLVLISNDGRNCLMVMFGVTMYPERFCVCNVVSDSFHRTMLWFTFALTGLPKRTVTSHKRMKLLIMLFGLHFNS